MSNIKLFQLNQGNDNSIKFLIAIATRKNETELEQLPIYKTVFNCMKFNDSITLNCAIAFENKNGLSTVYNNIIKTYKSYDYILFIHDDLWLNDVLFIDKILSASKEFDLIGSCGGKSWERDSDINKPIIWTSASRDNGMSGFMVHAADGNKINVKLHSLYNGRGLFATNYGICPARVLTIDGSFICFTKKAITENLRFDEIFKFHYYDMDISFQAYTKHLKTGTCAVLITHESLGESVSQSEYMEAQKKFLDKWFEEKENK